MMGAYCVRARDRTRQSVRKICFRLEAIRVDARARSAYLAPIRPALFYIYVHISIYSVLYDRIYLIYTYRRIGAHISAAHLLRASARVKIPSRANKRRKYPAARVQACRVAARMYKEKCTARSLRK